MVRQFSLNSMYCAVAEWLGIGRWTNIHLVT